MSVFPLAGSEIWSFYQYLFNGILKKKKKKLCIEFEIRMVQPYVSLFADEEQKNEKQKNKTKKKAHDVIDFCDALASLDHDAKDTE